MYTTNRDIENERLLEVQPQVTEGSRDKQLLLEFYENFEEMDNTEIQIFLNDIFNDERLKNVEYLPKDSELLEKYYLETMERNSILDLSQRGENLLNCIICNMNFESGCEVLNHPGCGHKFHWMCLESWLKVRRSCPDCNGNMRKEMILDVTQRRREVLV